MKYSVHCVAYVIFTVMLSASYSVPVQVLAQSAIIAPTPSDLWSSVQALLIQLREHVPTGAVQGVATSTLTQVEMQEQIVYLQKKIVQVETEIVTINSELAVLRPKLATAIAALSSTTPVVAPAPVEKRSAYKALTGSYALDSKDSVTQTDALKYCAAIAAANPTKNVWCSWDGQVIFGRKPSTYVLGASTTNEIEDLKEAIGRLERRLAVLVPRKAEYQNQIVALRAQLAVPVVVTPVPVVTVPPIVTVPVPPVVVVPSVPASLVTPLVCGAKPYLRKISVTNVATLKAALLAAVAGDYIAVSAGVYSDTFVIVNKAATLALPITICGETGTLIKSGSGYTGYGVHLKNVSHVVLANVSVSGYLKGVMLDSTMNSLLEHITVSDIGNEGVHFRQNSSNNIIQRSTIFNTGMVEDWYGEGVYIGSASSNWCKYTACAPDKSNWNQVLNNDIYHTAAESVDIKEGTTGGIIVGNRFEGSAMTGEYADSFIDVKGNNYIIKGNAGKIAVNSQNVSYQLDAYQHHVVYDGYGNHNLFETNTVTGVVPGYVVYLMSKGIGNVVMCDNKALTKAKGVTNIGVCKP